MTVVSKRDKEAIEQGGGVATMPPAPEGSAERVADEHDEGFVTHPPKSSVEPLGHAFCRQHNPGCPALKGATECTCPVMLRLPTSICADCGWPYSDHNPSFGEPPLEPGDAQIHVTDYGANGEAVDRVVEPKREEPKGRPRSQPGLGDLPLPPDWGWHVGLPVTRMILGFGGSPNCPPELAGQLDLDETVWLTMGCSVASTRYKRGKKDEDGVVVEAVGVTSLHIDSCELLDAEARPQPANDIPPDLIGKALVSGLVKRATAIMTAPKTDNGTADEHRDLLALRDLCVDLAHLLDPLPFDGDEEPVPISTPNPSGEESEPSQLEQSLAEAMAEA